MVEVKSIFEALNTTFEAGCKEEKGKKCVCGADLGEEDKFCKFCGKKVGEKPAVTEAEDDEIEDVEDIEDVYVDEPEEDVDVDIEEPIEDEEGEAPAVDAEEVRISADTVYIGDGFRIEEGKVIFDKKPEAPKLGKYNEERVKALKAVLAKYKAPQSIMKAYEMKLYERCTSWLEKNCKVRVDLTKGFSIDEAKKIREYLKAIKAPSDIQKAFENKEYDKVAKFIKRG